VAACSKVSTKKKRNGWPMLEGFPENKSHETKSARAKQTDEPFNFLKSSWARALNSNAPRAGIPLWCPAARTVEWRSRRQLSRVSNARNSTTLCPVASCSRTSRPLKWHGASCPCVKIQQDMGRKPARQRIVEWERRMFGAGAQPKRSGALPMPRQVFAKALTIKKPPLHLLPFAASRLRVRISLFRRPWRFGMCRHKSGIE